MVLNSVVTFQGQSRPLSVPFLLRTSVTTVKLARLGQSQITNSVSERLIMRSLIQNLVLTWIKVEKWSQFQHCNSQPTLKDISAANVIFISFSDQIFYRSALLLILQCLQSWNVQFIIIPRLRENRDT